MSVLRRKPSHVFAWLLALAVCAGLLVTTWRPAEVHASVPAPGIISTYAGGPGSGAATTIAQGPWGLAVAGSTVYVVDVDHFVVRALNTGTGTETVVAGIGVSGDTGDGGQATAAQLLEPTGVVVDSGGNVFIADIYRIRRVDHTTGVITTVVGNGTPGNSGDGGPATAATINGAWGLAIDSSDNLFIGDTSNNKVRRVDHNSGIITTVAGTGASGFSGDGGPATSATLELPMGLWVDGSGNLWIADALNNRVREVVSGTINTVAGDGVSAFGGDGGAATSAHLNQPRGVWVDGSGHLWIADSYNARIREVVGGTINTVAGNGTSGSSGDGGPATAAQLNWPFSAMKDGSGNLFIGDFGGKRLREVIGATISTAAGNGASSCARSGDGGAATDATLCTPIGLAVDGAGDLFIADQDNNVVRKVSPGGVISTLAGDGSQGSTGDGGVATSAKLNHPDAVAVDSSGDLYIADTGNNVVRKVHAGSITLFAGNYTAGLSGDGASATAAQLNVPAALAFDAGGNLFIADSNNNRIRKVTPGGVISTAAGTSYGYSGDGGLATVAQLAFPQGVAVDGAGNLYISDTGNSRIRKVDVAGTITTAANAFVRQIAAGPGNRVFAVSDFTNQVSMLVAGSLVTVAGTGTLGGAGDGGPSTAAQLHFPLGVAVDASGDIFISDTSSERVRRVQAFTAPSVPLAVSAVPGDNSATVRWTAPSSNGGLAITRYTITPSTGPPVVVTGAPPVTSARVSGLSNGTAYTFTVTAGNAWADGPASSPPAAATPTFAPKGVIITHAGTPASGLSTAIGQWPVALSLGQGDGSHLYVGDFQNGVVRDVAMATGNETVLAGASSFGYSGDGGPAVDAQMLDAGGIVTCGSGATYFADTDNSVVRKIDANGVITTIAGTGVRGYSGDGGPATSATLNLPFGLACGTGGWPDSPILFIADSNNGVIREISATGTISTLWCTNGTLIFPTGLSIDGNSFLDVADFGGNRIFRITPSCTVIPFAGNGNAGFSGDGGPALSATLNAPFGVLALGVDFYISDTQNHRVRAVDFQGNIRTVAGNGTPGFTGDGGLPTAAELNTPLGLGIALDHSGTAALFVADSANYRVREVTLNGPPLITTVAGNGKLSLSGDGGPAQQAQLANPWAIALDGSGNEYVADLGNSAIRKIAPNGVITTIAGNGVAGYSGDGAPGPSAMLDLPFGVALDPLGRVLISDGNNNRVRRVDQSTGIITTIAGDGTAGFSGDGSLAAAARLNRPWGIVVDGIGNIYIADYNNNRVRKIDHLTANISTVAGNGVSGFSGDGGAATAAMLNHPRALAIDGSGNLFVADAGNGRVRKIAAGTGIITTVAGNGQSGVSGDGGLATSAEMMGPSGVAVDASGNLYIADAAAGKVRIVDANGRISTAIGACGIRAMFSGDGGPASIATLNTPEGVAVDSQGNVFVADNNNNRVRVASNLAGSRVATCPGSAGTATSRGANQGPPGVVGPGPRLPEREATPRVAVPLQAAAARAAGRLAAKPSTAAPKTSGKTGNVDTTKRDVAPTQVAAPAVRDSRLRVTVQAQLPSNAGGGRLSYVWDWLVLIPVMLIVLAWRVRRRRPIVRKRE